MDELVVEVARLDVGAEVGLEAGLDVAADFGVAGPGLDETGEKSQNRCRCVSFSVIHLSGAHHVRRRRRIRLQWATIEAINLALFRSDKKLALNSPKIINSLNGRRNPPKIHSIRLGRNLPGLTKPLAAKFNSIYI